MTQSLQQEPRQQQGQTTGQPNNQQVEAAGQQQVGATGQQQVEATGQQQGGQGVAGGQGPSGMAQQEPGGQYLGQMYRTQSHLPEAVRRRSVEHLNRCLADTTVLMTQAKFAHWNVKGIHFSALHELFDELAEVLEVHIDDLAERATALGGEALGTARMAAQGTGIPPMPPGAVSGVEFVQELVERLAIHDAHLGQDIEIATQAGDVDTADLLNEISREVSKYRWFLEAHLQGAGQPQEQPAGGSMPVGAQPTAPPGQQ